MFLRIFGFVISGIISLVIYFEVSNVNFSSDEPNKDRLLVDLVSYVLDKLHYDPQIINDDFSIHVSKYKAAVELNENKNLKKLEELNY